MSYQVITQNLPNPAAGADIKFVPCGTDKVRLLALSAVLTTSAVVANRRPALALSDQGAGVFWSADVVDPQVASLAVRYSWARGGNLQIAATSVGTERVGLVLPDMWLQGNDTVQTITAAIDVGDQWSAIAFRGVILDSWQDDTEIARLAQTILAMQGG